MIREARKPKSIAVDMRRIHILVAVASDYEGVIPPLLLPLLYELIDPIPRHRNAVGLHEQDRVDLGPFAAIDALYRLDEELAGHRICAVGMPHRPGFAVMP